LQVFQGVTAVEANRDNLRALKHNLKVFGHMPMANGLGVFEDDMEHPADHEEGDDEEKGMSARDWPLVEEVEAHTVIRGVKTIGDQLVARNMNATRHHLNSPMP
jgi:hypothetical protein